VRNGGSVRNSLSRKRGAKRAKKQDSEPAIDLYSVRASSARPAQCRLCCHPSADGVASDGGAFMPVLVAAVLKIAAIHSRCNPVEDKLGCQLPVRSFDGILLHNRFSGDLESRR
jgi:hypothetical protein